MGCKGVNQNIEPPTDYVVVNTKPSFTNYSTNNQPYMEDKCDE